MARILIVDDDHDFIAIGKAALEKAGHEVMSADSGKAGYEAAIENKPDMVIADLMMETDDAGFILCHKLKKHEQMKNTPILMMTAVTTETGIKFGLERGKSWIEADEYLDKPVSPQELIEKVNQMLK